LSVDDIAWRAKYGAWNPTSSVVVKNSSEEIIDSSSYKIFARNGLIVFSSKITGPLVIDIENASKTRLGIRVVNKTSSESVEIEGFGFFYNTNVFLPPPLSERPPEATNLRISPSLPYMYSKMTASYLFSDLNRDLEDKEKTEIRWYINGVEREYLRGLLEWNDLSNFDDPIWIYGFTFSSQDVTAGMSVEEFARSRQESILKVGDVVYFTARPNDGKVFGDTMRSASVRVITSPPFISSLEIKGRNTDGSIQSSITTATTAFISYNFFDDGGENTSLVIWYVNGFEFKRGNLGETVGGFPNNELFPGEMKTNAGVIAIALGNDIEAEVRPSSGQTLGNSVRSASKTVENAPPSISSVTVSPSSPTSSSNLQVSYVFSDVDIRAGATAQTDQSSIKWFRKRGFSDAEEVTSVANQQVVPSTLTATGDIWYAEVIPFDGISVGDVVGSNSVTIG